jgi:hypothetical protein
MITLESSVDDLGLSVRTYNCLFYSQIRTVGELVQHRETDLLKTKNLGRKCLKEIKEYLAEHGLHLTGSLRESVEAEPFSLDNPPHALGLSYPVVHALHRGRINTVGELVQRSKRDLLCLQGIGLVKVKMIEAALAKHGLHLEGAQPEEPEKPAKAAMTNEDRFTAAVERLAVAAERIAEILGRDDALRRSLREARNPAGLAEKVREAVESATAQKAPMKPFSESDRFYPRPDMGPPKAFDRFMPQPEAAYEEWD